MDLEAAFMFGSGHKTFAAGHPADDKVGQAFSIAYICAMKPWGRFVFVLIAYGLMLVHTVVPHHHGPDHGGPSFSPRHGCILTTDRDSLLSRVFGTDLGSGHLENFNKSTDVQVIGPVRNVVADWNATLSARAATDPPPLVFTGIFVEKIKKKLLLASVRAFRAPPRGY